MDTADPPRRWWQKKRWIAGVTLAVVLAYPLSLWPACWFVLRLDPEQDQREVGFVCWMYAPVLRLIAESPTAVRNALFWTIELGAPRDGSFLRSRDHVVVWVNQDYGLTLLSFP